MKFLPCLLFAMSIALGPCLLAQEEPPSPPVRRDNASLNGNFALTLTASEKDQEPFELRVVVATPQFSSTTVQPATTFTGTLTPEEGGGFLVRYSIGSQHRITTTSDSQNGKPVTNTSYLSSATTASVRLSLGEPVEILKEGNRAYRLRVDRLDDKQSKAP